MQSLIVRNQGDHADWKPKRFDQRYFRCWKIPLPADRPARLQSSSAAGSKTIRKSIWPIRRSCAICMSMITPAGSLDQCPSHRTAQNGKSNAKPFMMSSRQWRRSPVSECFLVMMPDLKVTHDLDKNGSNAVQNQPKAITADTCAVTSPEPSIPKTAS